VSHHKEREEKICLNCGAEMHGRYCHKCGQENTHPQESFWHIVSHFVYDVTHFDGKFFSTLKHLLFKPGYLPAEYFKGRRTSYLHPIRMYVFASAIFFVIFLNFVVKPSDLTKGGITNMAGFDKAKQSFVDSFYSSKDTSERMAMVSAINAIGGIDDDHVYIDSAHHDSIATNKYVYASLSTKLPKHAGAQGTAVGKMSPGDEREKVNWNLTLNDEKLPNTIEGYDSAQAKLPPEKKDGWFKRMFNKKAIEITGKWREDKEGLQKEIVENFFHSIPKMMFISVPFVALIMELLYIRRRKNFYYVNHVIFIIYLYIAVFISLLVYYALQGLYNWLHFAPFHWLAILVIIYIYLYGLLAMHNFYKQGYIKSFFKYLILFFVCSILSALIAGIFMISSVIQV